MYGWLWRRLPGGTGARTGTMTLIFLALATILWFYAFPWLALHVPVDVSSP